MERRNDASISLSFIRLYSFPEKIQETKTRMIRINTYSTISGFFYKY